jgi:hypothetical protein
MQLFDYQTTLTNKIQNIIIMKKLAIIILSILFTGVISSCKKENTRTEAATVRLFANGFKRDLGSAD